MLHFTSALHHGRAGETVSDVLAVSLVLAAVTLFIIIWAVFFIWKTSTDVKYRNEALNKSYGKAFGMLVWMLFATSYMVGNGLVHGGPHGDYYYVLLTVFVACATYAGYWLTYKEGYRAVGRFILEIFEGKMRNEARQNMAPSSSGCNAKDVPNSGEAEIANAQPTIADLSKPYQK